MEFEQLNKNYQALYERLNNASVRWGQVDICAVTKTVDVETINMAWEAGLHTIGENRVQEVLSKREQINPGFQVHLIGRLQTNKVRHALPVVHMIQSLDREELLGEIDRRALALGIRMPVLIQVNIAKEPQKAGVFEENLTAFVREAAARPGVQVNGLMAVMPLVTDPEEVRPYFRRMRALFDQLREENISGAEMRILSMGMSDDCIVAAEEGATMVRPGRVLFGNRI